MTGLEKMIGQILSEAECAANAKVEEAKAEAKQLADEAKAEAEKIREELLAQSEVDAKSYLDRVTSSADLQRRTAILRAKQDVIASVLEKAYVSLHGLPAEAYFEMIRKILEKYALPEAGELYFSAADLARLPEGFEKEVEAIAAKKGGSLTLQKDGKEIEDGFVLVYGGVEENCTFRALMGAKKERLQDVIHQELFA